MVLIEVIPSRAEVVTDDVMVAPPDTVSPLDRPSKPRTVPPFFIRTVSDSVVVPDTTSVVAERLVMMVADSVVSPDTPRLF